MCDSTVRGILETLLRENRELKEQLEQYDTSRNTTLAELFDALEKRNRLSLEVARLDVQNAHLRSELENAKYTSSMWYERKNYLEDQLKATQEAGLRASEKYDQFRQEVKDLVAPGCWHSSITQYVDRVDDFYRKHFGSN